MARVIVFDVNETLLDLGALDPHFERSFGAARVREEWFQELQDLMLISAATGAYFDFGRLAKAALAMTAEKRSVSLSAADRSAILEGVRSLPPHRDVEEGLAILRAAGLRLAALTNGVLRTARAQLRNARLEEYFEEALSADEVRRLKPAREPYALAAKRMKVKLGDIRMVAAHSWDIAGATAAGCATAFIARPGKVMSPVVPRPDIRGRDLVEVAHKIVKKDRS